MDNSRLLGGRYEIKRHLQTGHVTLVYEGFDRQREQAVAIEVMRDVGGRDPAAAARLKAAGRATAALRHPNIAEVQAAEETSGLAYIVREQPSGGSLGELIARDGRLPAATAATIALQICEGLTYAHRWDVVHGSLIPSLALLTENHDVKLAGFGVAATLLTTDALDTRYAAPEQFQGAAGDARSDIYALGSCLYEMLLGLPPFAGDPQMFARIGPRVPPELGAIVRRLLAVDPGDRYQDAADVGADLSRYLGIGDAGGGATPPRAPAVAVDRPGRSVRPDSGDVGSRSLNRPVVVTAAVFSVVVLATAAFTARQITRQSQMVADSGGAGESDVEIGAEQPDTGGQSTSAEGPGSTSTSTSTESTTTDPSTTTTTDPAEDEEEEGDGDDDDDESEDESPEEPGQGGPNTTPTTSPATTTPPTSPSTTAAPATVPNVVGMSENQASGTLGAQGLTMSARRVNVANSSLDGQVLSQSPGGGSPHPASGTVNVDIGRYCFLIC